MLLHLGSAKQEARLSGGPCGDRARIGILGGLASREAVGEQAGLRWDELVDGPRLGECADEVGLWQTLWVESMRTD